MGEIVSGAPGRARVGPGCQAVNREWLTRPRSGSFTIHCLTPQGRGAASSSAASASDRREAPGEPAQPRRRQPRPAAPVLVEGPLLHSADDADDLAPGRLGFGGAQSGFDPLANRILVREVLAREAVADDDRTGRRLGVGGRELTSLVEWDSHRAEISRADEGETGDGPVRGPPCFITGQFKGEPKARSRERERPGNTDALDPGNARDLRQEAIVERHLLRVRVPAVWEIDAHGCHLPAVESRVGAGELIQTGDHQRRRDQQHDAKRRLQNDQPVQPPTLRTRATRGPHDAQLLSQLPSGGAKLGASCCQAPDQE